MTNIDKTMHENEAEVIDSQNDTETTDNPETETETVETEIVEEPDDAEVDVEELKQKLATAEAQKEHWRSKAQKAKETPKAPVEQVGVSLKDQIALVNAKVHEDDVDEVLEYAKFKKITVAEALKTSVIKSSLAEKSEQRATAEATHTSKSRGTTSKTTGETLLSKAQKTGELPESEEDIKRLLDARYPR